MSPPLATPTGPTFSRPFNYPINQPQRKLSVICVGAGASGLLLAYKLQRHFADLELDIYEKNPDVSGTWYENKYPGCACDVPSHCYTWSFEPKTDWSANYASAQEIHHYFRDFCDKYRLAPYIKLQHQVTDAKWDESQGLWHVTIADLKTGNTIQKSAQILLNAGGILNAWRFPPIPGIESFKGVLVHSAAWKEGLDLRGKTVGLIGNGSSGIQILPAIKDQVGKLVTFIREATWIAPPVGQPFRGYTEAEIEEFKTDPEHHLKTRREIEQRMNSTFEMFHSGSDLQKQTRLYMESEMSNKLNNAELEKVLVPSWSVGCRRITPGTNYLESLSQDNVQTVFGNITNITERGVVCDDDKGEYPVDVLICATGFDTTFKPRFPVVGRSGVRLDEKWIKEPKAYLGIAAPDYPNYFMTLGPNCPIGNGPVLIAIEAEVEYIVKMLAKFQKQNIRSFDVDDGAVEAFNQWKDEYMQHTIWTEECRSWYKAGSAYGKVAALWPGSTLHYLEALSEPRWEDWHFQYPPDHSPWASLGNGHSSAEKRVGGDLSRYIRDYDDSEIDICLQSKVEDRRRLVEARESPENAAQTRFEPTTQAGGQGEVKGVRALL